MRELMKFLNYDSHTVKVGWIDKRTFASLNRNKDEICVNVFLLIAEAFIHEYMHHKYDVVTQNMKLKDEEKFIDIKTKRKLSRMKVGEIMEIAKQVMFISQGGDDEGH